MPKITGVCVGESLVGDGNEVAHIDLLIGPRGSAVEQAYCNSLTNNKDDLTTLLALVAPNLMCKPGRWYEVFRDGLTDARAKCHAAPEVCHAN